MKIFEEQRSESSPKWAYSVRDLMRLTSLGRTRVFQEVREGRLVRTKCGRRTIFTHENVRIWLASLKSDDQESR